MLFSDESYIKLLQKCHTTRQQHTFAHNLFKEYFNRLHMGIIRSRLDLLEEILQDRYTLSIDAKSLDDALEQQKQHLQFRDPRTERRPYTGPVTFFSFVEGHEPYDAEFFRLFQKSLQAPFISENEFNAFYNNMLSFTIRSVVSRDIAYEVFPLMQGYTSLIETEHPLHRIQKHEIITNIFKSEGYRSCISKIGETLSQEMVSHDSRYPETPRGHE
jgi:hypothetical protein